MSQVWFFGILIFVATTQAYTVINFDGCVKICQNHGYARDQCQSVCRWPDIILKTERAANDACNYLRIHDDAECVRFTKNNALPQNFNFFGNKKRKHREIRVAEGTHVLVQATGEIILPFSGLTDHIQPPAAGDGPCECSHPVQPVAFEFGMMGGESTTIKGSLCTDSGCMTKADVPPPLNLLYNYPVKISYKNLDARCQNPKTAKLWGKLCTEKLSTIITLRRKSDPGFEGEVNYGDDVLVYSNGKAVRVFNLLSGKKTSRRLGLIDSIRPPSTQMCYSVWKQRGNPLPQRGTLSFGKMKPKATKLPVRFVKNPCDFELVVDYELLDPVAELLDGVDIAAF